MGPFNPLFEKNEMSITETKTEQKWYKGKINKLSSKGWGFIVSLDIEFTRIYFYWTALDHRVSFKSLHKGQEVEFTAQHTEDNGWRALKIRIPEPVQVTE